MAAIGIAFLAIGFGQTIAERSKPYLRDAFVSIGWLQPPPQPAAPSQPLQFEDGALDDIVESSLRDELERLENEKKARERREKTIPDLQRRINALREELGHPERPAN